MALSRDSRLRGNDGSTAGSTMNSSRRRWRCSSTTIRRRIRAWRAAKSAAPVSGSSSARRPASVSSLRIVVLVTIKDLAAEGMTCILVTHEMGFAREIADHIYFTDRGVIVEHGPRGR